MCQANSRTAEVGTPFSGQVTTGLENCQQTALVINSTSAGLTVYCSGSRYSVPAGMAATLPASIGQPVQLHAPGMGSVVLRVTDAILPFSLDAAPQLAGDATADAAVYRLNPDGDIFRASSGDYEKLIFIGSPEVFNQA